MQVNNKWNIGDALYLKQDILAWDKKNEFNYGKPKARVVVGVRADECSAGVQVHYLFRGYSEKGTVLEYYNEVEVTDKLE